MRGLIKTVLQSVRKSADPARDGTEPAQAPPAAVSAARRAHEGNIWPNEGATEGNAVYYPEVFEAWDLASAKVIALTHDGKLSTEERWAVETEFTIEHIASRVALGESHRVIDFGCGAGRMSRALIERFGCTVVGIDISQGMRRQAVAYVDSPRFTAAAPQEFDALVQAGFVADFGLACWSLQHCIHPAVEVARIANGLAMEAPFMLFNSNLRLVPTDRGWHGDGENVDTLMAGRFTELERFKLPPEVAGQSTIDTTSASWWQRRV